MSLQCTNCNYSDKCGRGLTTIPTCSKCQYLVRDAIECKLLCRGISSSEVDTCSFAPKGVIELAPGTGVCKTAKLVMMSFASGFNHACVLRFDVGTEFRYETIGDDTVALNKDDISIVVSMDIFKDLFEVKCDEKQSNEKENIG